MRNWLHKARGLMFFAPDGGESGGGSSGAASGGKPTVDVEKLFEGIPLDELDDKTKQILVTAKKTIGEGFATLQKSTNDEVANIQKQARDFQSAKDKLQQQLDVLTGGDNNKAKDDVYLKAAENVLRQQRYTEDQIKQHAPVFAEMLKQNNQILKKELGQDLGPMAQTVALNDAKGAFEEAQQKDTLGVLAIPEVAEKVWKATQDHVKKGNQAYPEFVLGLAKIQYMDYAAEQKAAGKEIPALFNGSAPTNMNTGGFTFPNAGRVSGGSRPLGEAPKDANTPRTTMNPDTEAAVASTFKTLGKETGVYPDKFKPATK